MKFEKIRIFPAQNFNRGESWRSVFQKGEAYRKGIELALGNENGDGKFLTGLKTGVPFAGI